MLRCVISGAPVWRFHPPEAAVQAGDTAAFGLRHCWCCSAGRQPYGCSPSRRPAPPQAALSEAEAERLAALLNEAGGADGSPRLGNVTNISCSRHGRVSWDSPHFLAQGPDDPAGQIAKMEHAMSDQNQTRPVASETASGTKPSSRRLRAALLGAVALATVGGVAVEIHAPAFAQSPAVAMQTNPGSFADIVEHVRGAVVSVKVSVTQVAADADSDQGGPQINPGDPLERFFRRFGGENSPFGRQQRPRGEKSQALGSGFIISADGYVVTNNHVVENATDVSLTMDDGRKVSANVVGTDKQTDLALMKITRQGHLPARDFRQGHAARRRLGDRGRQSRSASAARSPPASSRRAAATSAPAPMTTSCRSTRR